MTPERCGFYQTYLSRLERGLANPTLNAIEKKIANALGLTIYELWDCVISATRLSGMWSGCLAVCLKFLLADARRDPLRLASDRCGHYSASSSAGSKPRATAWRGGVGHSSSRIGLAVHTQVCV